jgi:hypothetical protein
MYRCIALLEVDLNLDRMPVVRIPEAAERLLWLAGSPSRSTMRPAVRDPFGQHAVALDDSIGDCLEQRPERVQNLLGPARRHGANPGSSRVHRASAGQ